MTTHKRISSNAELDNNQGRNKKNTNTTTTSINNDQNDGLFFEDPFEDEYDEEDVAISEKVDGMKRKEFFCFSSNFS
jgi:hypothetical protein